MVRLDTPRSDVYPPLRNSRFSDRDVFLMTSVWLWSFRTRERMGLISVVEGYREPCRPICFFVVKFGGCLGEAIRNTPLSLDGLCSHLEAWRLYLEGWALYDRVWSVPIWVPLAQSARELSMSPPDNSETKVSAKWYTKASVTSELDYTLDMRRNFIWALSGTE